MDFMNFVDLICEISLHCKFDRASQEIRTAINAFDRQTLIDIVREIGTIPECIEASSSLEKLYSKASDCLLARCFVELGLTATAVNERGNSADIVAQSDHGYTLVADAKTFRLSRTAKNQKDFKIDTLSKWRGSEHDYALLVAPYFQYPNTSSQIYSSALDKEVCLLAWEHILFLLKNNISESEALSLENIWKAPTRLIRESRIAYADRMNCHLPFINKILCDRISLTAEDFAAHLNECKATICLRGSDELAYLNNQCDEIMRMTKEQAISELLISKKIAERISTIERFVNVLREDG